MYKISVIIPVYNVANYIVRCIESVIKQDTEKVQIECILIDDCGCDSSAKIAQEFGLEYVGIDFKKKDGFLKTNKISRDLGLYRQNYCGCEFSNYNNKSD